MGFSGMERTSELTCDQVGIILMEKLINIDQVSK